MSDPAKGAAQWLAGARDGSPEDLGRVLEACRGYLLLVAERELAPDLRAKGGASDLVQETFLEAQRDFAQFHGDSEAELLAWLRRLLLNNLANFTRHYRATGKRRVGLEKALAADDSSCPAGERLAADTPSPSGEAQANEQAEAVRQALERLPEDYRRIIVLRYQEKRPHEEIARLMNRSANATRQLLVRAIERLQKELRGPA
jgi:RNA polymerase sigma-70 factor (ECF subfamily)